ncbi:MAG: glycosyltransferase family 10 [Hydrogenophaga sp.]|nr:glycosyltransferase family 10 [Hydrogenophaga sp.]
MKRGLLFWLLLFKAPIVSAESEKIIFITAPCVGDLLNHAGYERGLWGTLEKELKKCGYTLKQTTSIKNLPDFEFLILNDDLYKNIPYPKNKIILMLWEPPSVIPQSYDKQNHSPYGKIITWYDDWIDNQRYFKFYYPEYRSMISDIVDFDQKKFCTLVANNKKSPHPNELYSQRRATIKFFEQLHNTELDLYGHQWPALRTYKGSIPDKINCIKKYKFCICYENIKNITGYISEKIFNCFQAGCVPVYWGAKNVLDYIPQDCFIARENFTNNQELYTFLKSITKEQYQTYIDAIRNYLENDPRVQLFTRKNCIETIMRALDITPTNS